MITMYGDILGIEVRWLVEQGVIGYKWLASLVRRGVVKRLVHGGNGRRALVEWESLPEEIKGKVIQKLGKSPYDYYAYNYFRDYYRVSEEALSFYSHYMLPDGRSLSDIYDKRTGSYYNIVYTHNAQMLDAIDSFLKSLKGRWQSMGGRLPKDIKEKISEIVNSFREDKLMWHTLPKKPRPLFRKFKSYKERGYIALISGKFMNQNRNKINSKLESLILSLYVMKNKPHASIVYQYYMDFLAGVLEIYNEETGEFYNPKNFEPVSLSTIYNILREAENKLSTYYRRNDKLFYESMTPHKMLKPPQYSLSLISIDDRDLQLRNLNGVHPKVYIAYDVKSQAIIGWSIGERKDLPLVIDMFRNMFGNLLRENLGIPIELQVEHHLLNKIKEELRSVFPMVTFAPPGRAQAKYAETLNRLFKYFVEKYLYPITVGRHYARSETNRIYEQRSWTETGIEVKDLKLPMEQIRKLFKEAVEIWNNQVHNQYGISRKDVLKQFSNPHTLNVPKHLIAKYFGVKSKSRQIRRYQYVKVFGLEYWLESPHLIKRLSPNKLDVDVYYLPSKSGVEEVYIWQGDKYIGKGVLMPKYNRSQAERDIQDKEAEALQEAWIKDFHKLQRDNRKKIQKVGISKPLNREIEQEEGIIVEIENKESDLENISIESVIEEYKNKAFEDF